MGLLDKDDLITRIRYSSQWNSPCPEWVYNLIEAVDKMEERRFKLELRDEIISNDDSAFGDAVRNFYRKVKLKENENE